MHPERFDLVLYVPQPDLEARYEVLRVHTRNMKVDDDDKLRRIAEDTELFTGAELEGLCRETGIVALRENISAIDACDRHFQTIKASLKPASTRAEIDSYSSFMKTPSVTSSEQFKSSVKHDGKHREKLLGPSFSVKIGAVASILIVAAAKYFFICTDENHHELAFTSRMIYCHN